MWLDFNEHPSWTDVANVILSALPLIAAGIAAYKLLKRDKQREDEVNAIMKMSQHLAEAIEADRDRRIMSIRPNFVMIGFNETRQIKEARFDFKNVGDTAIMAGVNFLNCVDGGGLLFQPVANFEK